MLFCGKEFVKEGNFLEVMTVIILVSVALIVESTYKVAE